MCDQVRDIEKGYGTKRWSAGNDDMEDQVRGANSGAVGVRRQPVCSGKEVGDLPEYAHLSQLAHNNSSVHDGSHQQKPLNSKFMSSVRDDDRKER